MSWLQDLQQVPLLYGVFLAVAGAMAGSFASAAIYRIPREDMSVIRPARSRCPQCGATIRWHDNLPIIGYLLLGGKCRSCKANYGAGYMVHEIGLAALFWLAGHTWMADSAQGGGALALLFGFVAFTGLWIAAAIDFRFFILPDGITIGGVLFGLLAAAFVPAFHFWPGLDGLPLGLGLLGLSDDRSPHGLALISGILGAAISFGFLFGIGRLFSYLLKQEALGFGDVKYIAAVGAFLGLEGSLWTLAVGVFAGALLGVVNVLRMILVVRHRRRTQGKNHTYVHSFTYIGWQAGRTIPFGPPLILGTMLVMLFPSAVHNFFLDTWPRLLSS
ncbi:MAG: prepilin peptidase [Planctomycetota bacterium]|jgi:leader peptidase (prepilin peptidase)/N-methyltransferase|nr:prepilin peptidase [Planctomycetota bacterium]